MFKLKIKSKNNNHELRWFGYIHREDNELKIKRYFHSSDIQEAMDSPFSLFVVGPVIANTVDRAFNLLKDELADNDYYSTYKMGRIVFYKEHF